MLANDRLTPPLHVLAILVVGLATVLPSYYIADMASFRPPRALGPLVWSQSDTTSAPATQEAWCFSQKYRGSSEDFAANLGG